MSHQKCISTVSQLLLPILGCTAPDPSEPTRTSRAAPTPQPSESPPTVQEPLTPDEPRALIAAHEFVRRQCFTNHRCDADEMVPVEILETQIPFMVQGDPVLARLMLLRFRRNTLKAVAYGISRGVRGRPGPPGWTVYFEPSGQSLREPGLENGPYLRGLYLRENFEPYWLEHMSLRMDAPEKVVVFVETEEPARAPAPDNKTLQQTRRGVEDSLRRSYRHQCAPRS